MGDEPEPALEAEERAPKIAAMQQLIDEARAGGVSERSLDEIFAEARVRLWSAVSSNHTSV